MDQLTKDESVSLLADARVAHLGTIDGDRPYVTPMSYVFDGTRILFRTLPGRKLEAIKARPEVCVEVSSYDEETGDWASVIVSGTARVSSDDATRSNAVSMLLAKYAEVMGSPLNAGGVQPLPGMPQVVEVTIDEMSGMTSGRGWSRRTRPGRL